MKEIDGATWSTLIIFLLIISFFGLLILDSLEVTDVFSDIPRVHVEEPAQICDPGVIVGKEK